MTFHTLLSDKDRTSPLNTSRMCSSITAHEYAGFWTSETDLLLIFKFSLQVIFKDNLYKKGEMGEHAWGSREMDLS
jgi:hypothetical protein